jgi:hypothetical protein
MSIMHCSLLSLSCAFGFTPVGNQPNLTGLRALKIAQRRLRPEVRSKLLSVSSSRTDGNLAPDAWRFVFSDPGTSGHCRVVTVAAKTSSEHPATVEAFSMAKMDGIATANVILQNKRLLDTDQVLAQARSAAKLKGIRAAKYDLGQPRSGHEPMWTIHFYAENDELIADLQVGAKLGGVKIVNRA